MTPEFSVLGVLTRSARLFATRLPFLAALTLAVFLPGKLLLQLACAVFDIPPEGLAGYLLMDASTMVLSAWTIPAAIYGITRDASLGNSLAYGRALWGRMLWNKFKVEMTVTLYSLLLFVPGLMAMARLALVDAIVATEGAGEPDPLARSMEVTAGRRWKVFFVIAPLGILDLAGSFYLLGAVPRSLIALTDSVWSIFGMWSTIACLLMYVGRIGDPPHKRQGHRR